MMNTMNGSVDLRLVLKNSMQEEILQILETEVNLDGRYDIVGDTVYHLILRNKNLAEDRIIPIARIFRERGVNPAKLNRNAKAPVHLAIEKRMKDVTDFFIKYNPWSDYSLTRFFVEDENKQFWGQVRKNYNKLDSWDSVPLENASADFLQFLFENERNKNREDDDKLQVLVRAIDYNLQHILPVLVNHTEVNSITNTEYESPLDLFLKKSAMVKKAQSKCRSKRWYHDYTLRYAYEIIKILLSKGATAQISSIQLSMHTREELPIIKMLVNQLPDGSNERNLSSMLNALMTHPSMNFDQPEVLDILHGLQAKGLNVNEPDDFGMLPIQLAFESKNKHVIMWLIDAKADLTVYMRDGQSLMHYLITEKWQDEVFESMLFHVLVTKGAPMNNKDENGLTPLFWAVKFSDIASVRKLVRHGADVNCRDNNMQTPLHYFVKNNKPLELVELLLANGANANARDINGDRPLFHAINMVGWRTDRSKHWSEDPSYENYLSDKVSMTTLLLKYGAQVNTLHAIDNAEVVEQILMIDTLNITTLEEFLDYGFEINYSFFSRCLIERWQQRTQTRLHHHWLRLEAANLPCMRKSRDHITNYYLYNKFYTIYSKEVETLKGTFISAISIYDFLHINVNRRYIYINDVKLKELVNSAKLKEQFPRYSTIILASYREAVARKLLFESAKIAWLQLTNIYLPDLCIELILSYLSQTNLVDFVETDYKSKVELQSEHLYFGDEQMDVSTTN